MTFVFRVLLIIAAVSAFLYTINNIRKSRLQIDDSLFWFFFSFLLVLLALFPQIAYFFADLLGIISTVNLVFLVIIAMLIWRLFRLSIRLSQLDMKFKQYVEDETARQLDEKESHESN